MNIFIKIKLHRNFYEMFGLARLPVTFSGECVSSSELQKDRILNRGDVQIINSFKQGLIAEIR